ncbi:unnamed protein product [Rotaria magnacalcarata]|uniref:Thioredoxin domain-containing protein n=2 Tax=Rotaria magnacalcarata TaxID=392030 RepID=A0A818Z4H0_9BILA|nr:unnamed protein product [Rotaria magnacalcarata]CAF2080395.1 unnamed protein product [Rotaria magnacalcarata]CAF3752269.1 unnamed protein product [Rotaria magnacalcarata]CAF3764554.1 unnamed protein product [Rotaria magnacalcarata]
MGCCRKENKKSTNNDNVTKKTKKNKAKQQRTTKDKKKVTIKTIDEQSDSKFQAATDQIQLFTKVDNSLQQQQQQQQPSIQIPIDENTLEPRTTSPPSITSSSLEINRHVIDNISSSDNIHSIETFNDLQTFVEQNKKPISIVFFYALYCPYSKRAMYGLRQWARANKNRVFLYEVDVEQAFQLAEYYHIRTIPTVIAFSKNNLLSPIWQRTATNVFSSDVETPINQSESIENQQFKEIFREKLDTGNNVFFSLDPSNKGMNSPVKIFETLNETKQEQYLIILNNKQSIGNQPKLILAITNEEGQHKFVKTMLQFQSNHDIKSESIASSQLSPSIWNSSIHTIENDDSHPSSQQLISEEVNEYNGRTISKFSINTILTNDQPKNNDNIEIKKFTTDQYLQHVYLPNSNEIFYEKQFENTNDFNYSSSSDRFSTLTYQHVKDTNQYLNNQQEEICILYLGPNRCRGFEDNLHNETNSSKLSLLTLNSQSLLE